MRTPAIAQHLQELSGLEAALAVQLQQVAQLQQAIRETKALLKRERMAARVSREGRPSLGCRG